jgi:hypothetical protein
MITEVKLKPVRTTDILETESPQGLRFAVVLQSEKIIALFDDYYWAEVFVNINKDMNFLIREVAE